MSFQTPEMVSELLYAKCIGHYVLVEGQAVKVNKCWR